MKNHYTPRHKTHAPVIPGGKRLVRIDARTQIEVNAGISDEAARERFFARAKTYSTYGQGTPNLPDNLAPKEVPVGDLAELAAIVDDTNLPETE